MANESMNTNEKQAGRAEARAEVGQGPAGGVDAEGGPAAEPAPAEPAPLHIGIDVGSTTVKLAILDKANDVKFSVYRRHHADVRATIVEVLSEAAADFGDKRMTIAITGSGGLLLAQWLGIEFVQEVIASKTAVETFIPATDVAIELGGEDAKIIYFDQGIEQRMNGTCAGGTGAFIDQMAALLNTDAGGLNVLAQGATTLYPIASRCGVFAKTDMQPPSTGRAQGGHRGVHLPIGGDADHQRPGMRPPHPRPRGVPRRPLAVPSRAAQALLRDARVWTTSTSSCPTTPTCSWPAAVPSRARPARRRAPSFVGRRARAA